jgi:hypothetical protein
MTMGLLLLGRDRAARKRDRAEAALLEDQLRQQKLAHRRENADSLPWYLQPTTADMLRVLRSRRGRDG